MHYQVRGEQGGIFLSEYTLVCLGQVEMNYSAFLKYLLQKRVGEFVLLAILSSTYLGIFSICAYAGWVGLSAGMFVTDVVSAYGVKGVVLFLAGLLPHQILLIPCGAIFLCWCYKMCVELYYPAKSGKDFYVNKKQFIVRKFMQFQVIIGVVIIACLVECYVNPYIMRKILKFF